MAVKPITPDEIIAAKKSTFPDFVIEAWNEIIAENFSVASANFKQEAVIERIIEKSDAYVNRFEIFQKHWLDVEDIYRAEGWKVEYDKPGYNETYGANFTFTKKRSRRMVDDKD